MKTATLMISLPHNGILLAAPCTVDETSGYQQEDGYYQLDSYAHHLVDTRVIRNAELYYNTVSTLINRAAGELAYTESFNSPRAVCDDDGAVLFVISLHEGDITPEDIGLSWSRFSDC